MCFWRVVKLIFSKIRIRENVSEFVKMIGDGKICSIKY